VDRGSSCMAEPKFPAVKRFVSVVLGVQFDGIDPSVVADVNTSRRTHAKNEFLSNARDAVLSLKSGYCPIHDENLSAFCIG